MNFNYASAVYVQQFNNNDNGFGRRRETRRVVVHLCLALVAYRVGRVNTTSYSLRIQCAGADAS